MLKKVAVLFSMILLASSAALAGDLRPYISLRGGVSNVNSDITNAGDVFALPAAVKNLNDSTVFFGGAALGVQYKSLLRAEVEYGYRDRASYKDDNTDYKFNMQSYMLNMYFDFPTKFILKPYLSAGAGFADMKYDDGVGSAQNTIFAYGLGAGVSYPVTDNVNVDLGYRFLKAGGMDVGGANLQNYAHDVYLGLRYTFGEDTAKKKAAEEKAAAEKAAADKAAADKAAAEKAAAEKAAADKAAADKAAADKAAADEAAKQAAAQKAITDDSAMAAQVAEAKARRAKPVLKAFKLEMATFDTGKADLKPASKASIAAQAAEIKALDYKKVTVEGHTDSTGSAAVNKDLSLKRAKAVYDEFAANGIPTDKMSYQGFGSTMPIADNNTAEGRAKNRRVEIFVE
ncbi:MAG: OmpA family protein [Endomicrobia bacterium]|nr:OmpA family protein [Endomicrobiia bacterium]